jgi:hypothetical protein
VADAGLICDDEQGGSTGIKKRMGFVTSPHLALLENALLHNSQCE